MRLVPMSKRRHCLAVGFAGVSLGLIITPMLDMSFQILAFFIMTYHPSALEGHVPGRLAPAERPAHLGPDQPVPGPEIPIGGDPLDELTDVILVDIKATGKGQETGLQLAGSPRQLFIKTSVDTQAQMLADVNDDFGVALRRLEARLADMLKKDASRKTSLKIVADGELRQQYVVGVYDACKKAGFVNIFFVPPPLLNTKLR
jgi:biopolymer transport protein ExbD